jgi:very-short-patch-repair endonuclease
VLWPGVYAVGRAAVTRLGLLMAAVLACGPTAVLSDESAAELWAIRPNPSRPIHVSVREVVYRKLEGIRIHHRKSLSAEHVSEHLGIPATDPVQTLIDIASHLSPAELEAAVNEADKCDLLDPVELRTAVNERGPVAGKRKLSQLLDRRTFILTDSELERRFLPIPRRAGLPKPQTQVYVNGFRVDFYWPDLPLIVETDGLRYHRTPAQQARDRLRDQTHAAAGVTTLRFTHAQIRYEPGRVEAVLRAVARRLRD